MESQINEKFPFYKGNGKGRSETTLTKSTWDPAKYHPDDGLIAACNVAMILGKPLLLTGEPGTGKTRFADYLAWQLGLENLKFECKSTSEARDLFYTYDILRHYHDLQLRQVQTSQPLPSQKQDRQNPDNQNVKGNDLFSYLTYQPLGKAILFTQTYAKAKPCLPPLASDVKSENLDFAENKFEKDSVVLIDEVDKAPRDFSNDILNEIEQMFFRIPELDNQKVEAAPNLMPIVIITSNNERDLPDAFLRRCVFFHIPFPEPVEMLEIVALQLSDMLTSEDDPFLKQALEIFYKLREEGRLEKKPTTAELLDWLRALLKMTDQNKRANPFTAHNLVRNTLGTLIKKSEDLVRAKQIIEKCLK